MSLNSVRERYRKGHIDTGSGRGLLHHCGHRAPDDRVRAGWATGDTRPSRREEGFTSLNRRTSAAVSFAGKVLCARSLWASVAAPPTRWASSPTAPWTRRTTPSRRTRRSPASERTPLAAARMVTASSARATACTTRTTTAAATPRAPAAPSRPARPTPTATVASVPRVTPALHVRGSASTSAPPDTSARQARPAQTPHPSAPASAMTTAPPNLCLPGADGLGCVRTCDEVCPSDYTCVMYMVSVDPLFICLYAHLAYCRPCDVDSDCRPDPSDQFLFVGGGLEAS